MKHIVIIGSGASGVHFALSVLKKGYPVTMLDVGYKGNPKLNPEDSYADLKTNLDDPVEYFMGKDFGSVIYPDFSAEYYGFPPSKDFVFEKPQGVEIESRGFEPLTSFARGGLAQAWTGAVYPFSEGELSDFPFGFSEIEPYYNEIARRIGISGQKDDLQKFLAYHDHIQAPIALNCNSDLIMKRYNRCRGVLNKKLGIYMGRSRVATISNDKDQRKKCDLSGRCLWGCPTESLYTPSITLEECLRFDNFNYVPNFLASRFKFNPDHEITSVVGYTINDRKACEVPADVLVLAAGTLSSSRIFMESIYADSGQIIKLGGFMDNRQIMVPFVNLAMLTKPYDPDSYQYHLLGFGLEQENEKEFIHCLITTLTTATVHPIISRMPIDLKTGTFMFRNIRSAMGVVNVNFPDYPRQTNYVTLRPHENSGSIRLFVNYEPRADEKRIFKTTLKTIKKALFKLGCIVPPGMIHVRPMGASVHYAGTLAMSNESRPLTTTRECRSRDFKNLYIADGSTFPYLPSKNITFTLMANAVRIAETAF